MTDYDNDNDWWLWQLMMMTTTMFLQSCSYGRNCLEEIQFKEIYQEPEREEERFKVPPNTL